jgi:integrase
VGEIASNPAELVDPPKGLDAEDEESSEEIRALTIFEAVRGTRWENLYVVAVRTGLRQGELLGLKWADLNLDVSPAVLTLRRSLAERSGGGFNLFNLWMMLPSRYRQRALVCSRLSCK